METTQKNRAEMLRALAETTGPCITIALAGGGPGVVAAGLKDAINTVHKELHTQEATNVDELLDPIDAIGGEAQGEMDRGLVIFRSPSVMQVHKPRSVQPMVRVNEHFDLRTLLSVVDEQRLFYILALSQK